MQSKASVQNRNESDARGKIQRKEAVSGDYEKQLQKFNHAMIETCIKMKQIQNDKELQGKELNKHSQFVKNKELQDKKSEKQIEDDEKQIKDDKKQIEDDTTDPRYYVDLEKGIDSKHDKTIDSRYHKGIDYNKGIDYKGYYGYNKGIDYKGIDEKGY